MRLQQLANLFTSDLVKSSSKQRRGNIRNELSGLLMHDVVLLWLDSSRAGGKTMTLGDQIKTIDNITLDDVVEHHTLTHTIQNMRFIIAGKSLADVIKLKKSSNHEELPAGECLEIPFDEYQATSQFLFHVANRKV